MSTWLFLCVLFVFSPTLLVHASTEETRSPTNCMSVPGVETLMSEPPRFVVFGELHGTSEIPAMFAESVCNLSENRQTVVAVEFGSEDGQAINAFVHDPKMKRGQLLRHGDWKTNDDGRTSEAMFSMFERLRRLVQAGHRIRVVGIVPSEVDDLPQSYYELGVANALRRAAGLEPKAVVVVLIGNIHAGKNTLKAQGLRPAISLLPPNDVISLRNALGGGSAWNCQSDGCRSHVMGDANVLLPRGIVLDPKLNEGFDGVFAVGSKYSSSQPMADR